MKWDIRWAVYSGIIAIGYGFLDEFLQTFVPTRNGSIIDSVINSTGAFFALGLMAVKAKRNEFDEKLSSLT